MSARPKRIKNKRRQPRILPAPISKADLSDSLDLIRNDPAFFCEQAEAVWDWAGLRSGGKLEERIRALDQHFVAIGKTQTICPIVLLLTNGKQE